ncbi:MAG: hypothetical protein ACI9KE_006641 [Polyangiales bacterium]|jgi:hypothetical protein
MFANKLPPLPLVLSLLCLACSGPETPAEDETESNEAEAPSGAQGPGAVADLDFVPLCMELERTEHPAGSLPNLLADFAPDAHDASRRVLRFARSERSTPTLGGYHPSGHMFRWQLVEEVSEPRASFSNTDSRERITRVSRGAPVTEGYGSSQIRTFQARLRTQSAREITLAARNTSAPGEVSIAELTCEDHGALPQLTPAHLSRWGWLPDSLRPVEALAAAALVEEFQSGPEPFILIRADDATQRALKQHAMLRASQMPDGTLEIRPLP